MKTIFNTIRKILVSNPILVHEVLILLLALMIGVIQYQFRFYNLKFLVTENSYKLYYYLFLINTIVVYLLISLLSINKLIYRVMFMLVIITTAIYMYYNIYYKVLLSKDIYNAIIGNYELAGNFVNTSMILFVLIYGFIPIILLDFFILKRLKKNYSYISFTKIGLIIFSLFALFLLIIIFNNRINNKWYSSDKPYLESVIYPENLLKLVIDLQSNKKELPSGIKLKIKEAEEKSDYKEYNYKNNTSKTIVFVFGESLTATHLKSSGYFRNTTPNLEKQKNLIFFTKTRTCATMTLKAHPCISKPITTEDVYSNYDEVFYNNKSINSFITILKNRGYKTYYIHEFLTESSLRKIVSEADSDYLIQSTVINVPVSITNKIEKERFIRNKITEKYKSLLTKVINNKEDRKLIIVWLSGSHIPYDNDYTKEFEKYKPVFSEYKGTTATISPEVKTKEDFEALNNSYDNTIAYTDSVMNWTINELNKSKQNTMMFFVGDHGENLTDNKLSMHGMPISMAPKAVMNPAMFVWFSDKWLKNISSKDKAKAKLTSKSLYNYENIFYDVINCAGLTSKYQPKNSNICSK